MSQGMAREIKSLLSTMSSVELVADELIKKWHRGVLSPMEVDYLGQFLYDCGLHRSLLSESIFQFKNNKSIPIKACLACIDSVKDDLSIDTDKINALIQACENFSAQKDLLRSKNIVAGDLRLLKLKEVALEEDLSHKSRELEKYKRQLHAFMKDESWDLAHELIASLQKNFPEDAELLELNKDISYKKALKVLKKYEKIHSEEAVPPLNSQGNKAPDKEKLADSFLHLAKTKSDWAYDISYALLSIEEVDLALQAIRYSNSEKKSWLEIQILLEAHRYVQLLEKCESLRETASDPENLASLSYYQAQALWGLDQKSLAIKQLEDLNKLRPNFRSALSLLLKWKADLI